MDTPELTGTEQAEKDTRFKPGQSGNPAGRPKGARSKYGEQFVQDFAEHWATHGKQALDTVAQDDPSTYCKIAAAIVPKVVEVGGTVEHVHAVTMIGFDAIRQKANTRADTGSEPTRH